MAIRFTGLASGLDTESMVKELMKAERIKVDKVIKQKTKVEWKNDIWKDINNKIFGFFSKQLNAIRMTSTYDRKMVSLSDESKVGVTASGSASNGVHTLSVTQLAQSARMTGGELKSISGEKISGNTKLSQISETIQNYTENPKFQINGIDIEFKDQIFDSKGEPVLEEGKPVFVEKSIKDMSVNEFISRVKAQVKDININFDENYGRFFISAKKTGAESEISLSDSDIFTALGLAKGTTQNGQPAKFNYNGQDYTSDKNETTINGLTFNFKGETTQAVSITVNQDTQGLYDTIKDFVNEYNSLIEEINTKYYANSARGYEPLTDDEKSAMSENDIKLWEEKIKGSLLRRDSLLSTMASSMRSILTSTLIGEGDDAKVLSYLGIETEKYVVGKPENAGKLIIKGDPDFGFTESLGENRLQQLLTEDPEKVSEILRGVGNALHEDLQKKMKSTDLSSALTVYNDKQMKKQVEDYEKRIAIMEEKLLMLEDRYYKQFTAMEKIMQKANSQMSWISNMLGGGM